MNNDCVMPATSHFNQVSYSGKEAFRPGELTYFVRTAVGGAPTLFFIHYSLLFIIHLIKNRAARHGFGLIVKKARPKNRSRLIAKTV